MILGPFGTGERRIGRARLNLAHPLLRGLARGWVSNGRSWISPVVVTDAVSGPTTPRETLFGTGYQFLGGAGNVGHASQTAVADSSAWTLLCYATLLNRTVSSSFLTMIDNSSAGSTTADRSLAYNAATSRVVAYLYDGAVRMPDITYPASEQRPALFAAVATGSSLAVYADGATSSAATTNSGYTAYSTPHLAIGRGAYFNASTQAFTSNFVAGYGLLIRRALSPAEIFSLTANPLQIFEDRAARRYFVPFVGGEAFSADLSAPSFAMAPQQLTRFNDYAAQFNAASFAMTPQQLIQFNDYVAALSAASLAITPQELQHISGFLASLSTPSFAMSPQQLVRFNDFTASLSAPALRFTTNALEYIAEGSPGPADGRLRGLISVLNGMGMKK